MEPTKIDLAVIVSHPYSENTIVVRRPDRDDCLVIDPGLEPHKILQHLEAEGLTPAAILNTHGHSDHIGGNEALKQKWPDCPLVIGRGDAPKLTDPVLNLSAAHGVSILSPEADQLLDEGDTFSAAGFDLEVFEIPGHSIGHIVFVWKENGATLVYGGDVLFQGGIGRYDFPDGNFEDLVSGIHNKLFTLPDDTVVLPGHGPATTIGVEKQTNPYVGAPAGYQA